jgi:hypothetical protein
MLQDFLHNFAHNLFKPLLLFFYAGFAVSLLKVKFEFPKPLYQGLTIYLLLAIGWHGGEELAALPAETLAQAAGFMILGFFTNLTLGFIAYFMLRSSTRLRKIDAATVAGFYGSDSAGTFVTCLGVLTAANITFAPFMPVLLAVMEIPGCLVALYLVSRLRREGMDSLGNMPGEPGYSAHLVPATARVRVGEKHAHEEPEFAAEAEPEWEQELVGAGTEVRHVGDRAARHATTTTTTHGPRTRGLPGHTGSDGPGHSRHGEPNHADGHSPRQGKSKSFMSREMLHEVFLNPSIFLLFAGITIGFISRIQGATVTKADDVLFVNLFQGLLCLFLLEMGMTASQKLKDIHSAGWQFALFGLIAPNLFAITGICLVHLYSLFLGQPFELGTYVLFAVLCGSSSYIAMPAVQRLGIPESSPTLPLASSLGVTFTYNVTIGIPVYILAANILTSFAPVYI